MWPFDSRWSISYWWSFGPKSLSLSVSKIFPQTSCAYWHYAKSSLCMCDIMWHVLPMWNLSTSFNFLPYFAYLLCHFHWALMKNKGCSLSGPIMLKAKSCEKFSKSKNLQNCDLLGALEIRGYEKLRFLLQKAHPCVNARRLSHFALKLVGGLTSRGGRKKSQKVLNSRRNDVSPFTQGLRYHTACDIS